MICAQKRTAKNPSLWLSLKRISQQMEWTQLRMSNEYSQHPPLDNTPLCRTEITQGDPDGPLPDLQPHSREWELIPLVRHLPSLSSLTLGPGSLPYPPQGAWHWTWIWLEGDGKLKTSTSLGIQKKIWWWTWIPDPISYSSNKCKNKLVLKWKLLWM